MIVPAAGEDQRFAVFGALDYQSGRVVHQISQRKDTAAFLRFLDQVAATYPDDQLVLVLDNVGYHTSHLARSWWVDHQDRIRPFWLPAYSPELNLIERVWRHLKDKLSCHRWWNDLDALQSATSTLLDQLEACFASPTTPKIRLVRNLCESA
jgi:transposase